MAGNLKECMGELTRYMGDNGISTYPYPKVSMIGAPQKGDAMLSNTGHYNPITQTIVLYTYNRHPKDVLRSFAHEMIHHDQNLSGQMTSDKMGESNDPKYTQNNPHMRKLEEDAYKRGNMMFRDWTDNKKYGK